MVRLRPNLSAQNEQIIQPMAEPAALTPGTSVSCGLTHEAKLVESVQSKGTQVLAIEAADEFGRSGVSRCIRRCKAERDIE